MKQFKYGYEISEERAKAYFDFIDNEINVVKLENKGWLVDSIYTDKYGNEVDGSSEYITGYVIDKSGNSRHRQLVTISVRHKSTFEGFYAIKTKGMDERFIFVLMQNLEDEDSE